MGELPNVFKGNIEDLKIEEQEYFYGSDRGSNNKVNVIKKINDIFASKNHVYKSKVRIKLKDRVIEKEIVGKTGNSLLTLNGEHISIIDILDIDKI